MRRARSAVMLAIVSVALAACAAEAAPQWTFSPTASPSPAASSAASAAPSGAPSSPAPSPSGGASAAPGGSPGQSVTLKVSAQNVAYDVSALEAPANTPFTIEFTNNDAGVPHNVAIHKDSPTGAEVFKGEIFNGVGTRTYQVPALPAGTYGFVCSVHPNMTGTLTVK